VSTKCQWQAWRRNRFGSLDNTFLTASVDGSKYTGPRHGLETEPRHHAVAQPVDRLVARSDERSRGEHDASNGASLGYHVQRLRLLSWRQAQPHYLLSDVRRRPAAGGGAVHWPHPTRR